MYLLLSLFTILFCSSFFYGLQDVNQKSKVVFGWIMILALTIICGFRYEFGGDWKTYIDAFNVIKAGGVDYPHEPIFRNLVKFLTQFNSGYLLLNIISTVLFLGFITVALYKSKLEKELLIYLFFVFPIGIIFMNLGFIRQAIACSICLLSYVYFIKKEYIPTILLLLLAQGFHVSAFLFIFYYLFLYWNNLEDKKAKKYLLLGTSVLGLICVVLLFKIRRQYIGGYKSDGLFPRVAYVAIFSSILIYLKNLLEPKKALKLSGSLFFVLVLGFIISRALFITTVMDRALYYLILPIGLEIVRQLISTDRKIKLRIISFHFFYSMIFLISWFALSSHAERWKVYKFWTF